MRFTVALALLALMASGCKKTPEETDDTDTPTPPDTDTDVTDTGPESCGPNAPVLEAITIENGSDTTGVQLDFTLTSTDIDGDLHEISFELWLDDVVDGSVDTAGPAPLTGGPAIVQDANGPVAPCSIAQGLNLTVTVPVDGGTLAFDTEMDFAWRVLDADGNPSNVLVQAGYTPKADGSDGGVVDPPDPTGDTGTIVVPPAPTGDTGVVAPPGPTGDTGSTDTASTDTSSDTGN